MMAHNLTLHWVRHLGYPSEHCLAHDLLTVRVTGPKMNCHLDFYLAVNWVKLQEYESDHCCSADELLMVTMLACH